MKLHWKITAGVVALGGICALVLLSAPNRARHDLDATRRALRQQGFKIDLREFNLSTSPEEARRAALIGTTSQAALKNAVRPGGAMYNNPGLLKPAGKNAALVVWQLQTLRSYNSRDLWPELRETFRANQTRLEAAGQAAISGPIRFEPLSSQKPNPLLPYLADLKGFETAFGVETVLALHDGQQDAAWTNLLAATCLVTEYNPEPIEISHLIRFACVDAAFDTMWNALQSRDWTEGQLAELQRRWQTADFWSGLPATAAYRRASAVATCQLERQEPLTPGLTFQQMVRSPKDLWFCMTGYWRQLSYRNQGSYEDEKALLLYYRDRQLELQRVVHAATWSDMRLLPGVTNVVPFTSRHSSAMLSVLNTRQMMINFQAKGRGLLGRAAEAEARCRLIVCALALERYRARHGFYPKALEGLVPELLESTPTDFMDGRPLRYQPINNAHFVLYSVGLDCVDNGGELRQPRTPGLAPGVADFGFRQGTDLVWPRPASAAEAELLQREETRAEAQNKERIEELQAAAQWRHSAWRQANVEAILSSPPPTRTNQPAYRGGLLSEALHNEETSATNKLSLTDMLTLHQVLTGAEPEAATFELPIKFDALTNLGGLNLYVDPIADKDSDDGCSALQFECRRATNGDCLLVWSTIYESSGKHALLVALTGMGESPGSEEDMSGPLTPVVVSNLCQFSLSSAYFDRDLGANFRAKLPEQNGTFSVELKSPTGECLKTLTGSTSNGIITAHWDLTDDHGRPCTNDSYASVFHITLPDSGRSQKLAGP